MDQKFEKWQRWIDKIYEEEVVSLVEHQQIFRDIQDIIKANPNIQKPNAFYRFLEDTYGAYIVIGIRRQIKCDKDSISLIRLLTEIKQNPCVMSRNRFVGLYQAGLQSVAMDIFDEHFSGNCTNHIDPAIVQQDLDKLKAHNVKVEEYADKRVAHHDKRKPKVLTFCELDPPINCLKKLVIKYHLLLTATDLTNCFVPPYLEADMKVIFSVPWILPD